MQKTRVSIFDGILAKVQRLNLVVKSKLNFYGGRRNWSYIYAVRVAVGRQLT